MPVLPRVLDLEGSEGCGISLFALDGPDLALQALDQMPYSHTTAWRSDKPVSGKRGRSIYIYIHES